MEGELEAGGTSPIALVTERVLVLVDDDRAAPRAVRRAARLAALLHGSLVALVVDGPAADRLSFDRRRDAQQALDGAVDLGAEVLRIEADDAWAALEAAVAARHPTHVVLPQEPTGGLARLRRGSLAEQLLRADPDLEVHLVDVRRA